jgi:hypothetical protein
VNAAKRFVFATLAFGTLAYLVKGRDSGLPLWVVLIAAAVFLGINLLGRFLTDRYKGE